MKIDLNDLAKYVNEYDAAEFDDVFGNIGGTADPEQTERILSSVMRKAGSDMKETMINKKTKRHSKRFVGFAAAAAVALTGAIGAGAAYVSSKGFETGLRPIFRSGNDDGEKPFEFTEETEAQMNRISVRDGEVIENTFEDIDVTFEGTVAYHGSVQTILTIRRKDGTPFETPEGYEWRVMFSDSEYDLYGYQMPSIDPLEIISTTEDGSLSLMIGLGALYSPSDGGTESEDNGYPLKFGFTDLYLVPSYQAVYENGDSETLAELDELNQTLCDLSNTMTEVRENSSMFEFADPDDQFSAKIWHGDPFSEDNEFTRKYYELYDSIVNSFDELSEESYKGRYTVSIDTSELASVERELIGQYNGDTVTVKIDTMGIRIAGNGDYYKQPFAFNEVMFDSDERPPLTVHYSDGTSTKLRDSGNSNSPGSWEIYYSAGEPLLTDNIEYLTLGTKTIRFEDTTD